MQLDESVPTQRQLRAFSRRVSPPENEVPTVVPVRHVLARPQGAVLSLLGARVFSTGVLLELDVRLERRPTPEQAAGLHEFYRPLEGDAGPDQRLHLRISFSDGRSVDLEDLRSGFWSPEREVQYADPTELVLRVQPSASTSGHGQATPLWCGPLPPEGPVEVTCSWPALGVPDSRVLLDGSELLRAGRAAEVLWPFVEEATPQQLAARYAGSYVPLKAESRRPDRPMGT